MTLNLTRTPALRKKWMNLSRKNSTGCCKLHCSDGVERRRKSLESIFFIFNFADINLPSKASHVMHYSSLDNLFYRPSLVLTDCQYRVFCIILKYIWLVLHYCLLTFSTSKKFLLESRRFSMTYSLQDLYRYSYGLSLLRAKDDKSRRHDEANLTGL